MKELKANIIISRRELLDQRSEQVMSYARREIAARIVDEILKLVTWSEYVDPRSGDLVLGGRLRVYEPGEGEYYRPIDPVVRAAPNVDELQKRLNAIIGRSPSAFLRDRAGGIDYAREARNKAAAAVAARQQIKKSARAETESAETRARVLTQVAVRKIRMPEEGGGE